MLPKFETTGAMGVRAPVRLAHRSAEGLKYYHMTASCRTGQHKTTVPAECLVLTIRNTRLELTFVCGSGEMWPSG